MTLLAAQANNSLGNYYKIMPKGIDITLGPEYHNKLLIQNNVELNNQRAIAIINIVDHSFFSVKFNPTPEIKGSSKVTIQSFLYHQCKIISIECTRDVAETGKYLLIVHNNNIAQAKTKLG